MSKTLKSGRKLVDPFEATSAVDSENLSATSSVNGRPVVDNTQYGHCSKCSNAMSVTKNANGDDIFFCTECRVSMPCKSSV